MLHTIINIRILEASTFDSDELFNHLSEIKQKNSITLGDNLI